jgi:hypothetical protein
LTLKNKIAGIKSSPFVSKEINLLIGLFLSIGIYDPGESKKPDVVKLDASARIPAVDASLVI